MHEHFFESLKLSRIDLFIRLVAASECSEEDMRIAIQWMSELSDEVMSKRKSSGRNKTENVFR